MKRIRTMNSKKLKKSPKSEFERYLERLEDPKNHQGVNYDLPENPTSLQVVKFNICQSILVYQQDNDLTDKELLERINCDLSIPELEEILFCQIEKFTLDRLMTYANHLFAPAQIKITITKPASRKKNSVYAR